MFTKARLKLTAWYLVIIMLVSVSFSIAIYGVLTGELDRVERIQRQRQERQSEFWQRTPRAFMLDPELVKETKDRLKAILLLVNIGILAVSGLSGYFLAGRTLNPIKEMVDEQNRFITDASHELRTPLTALRTAIEVHLRDKALNLKEAKDVLKGSLDEVENLQSLSDNLLILAKAETSGDNLNLEMVNIKEAAEEAVGKLRVLIKQKNIIIKQTVPEINFLVDREKIFRLLVILLDNAVKYSPSGGEVKIVAQEASDKIKIEVSDQGMGISGEDLARIFDRFYRADKSRSLTAGYGLGLAIARKIAEQHQGTISVESKVGKGSTFTVQLPLRLAV